MPPSSSHLPVAVGKVATRDGSFGRRLRRLCLASRFDGTLPIAARCRYQDAKFWVTFGALKVLLKSVEIEPRYRELCSSAPAWCSRLYCLPENAKTAPYRGAVAWTACKPCCNATIAVAQISHCQHLGLSYLCRALIAISRRVDAAADATSPSLTSIQTT